MRRKQGITKILLKLGLTSIGLSLILTGCGKPQFQSKVYTSHQIIKDKQYDLKMKQTKQGVTIEDKGYAGNLSTNIRLQECSNGQLQTERVKKCDKNGQCWYENVPSFVNANPFNGVYVRKIKFHNNTNHILYLNRTDVVLVDAAGTEHEAKTKESLEEYIESLWACSNVKQLTNSVARLKVLGDRAKVRPGRNSEFLLPFVDTSINIAGEWQLEIIDVPTKTDEAGKVLKKVSFEIPFLVKETKTQIDYKKDGTYSPWKEINRTVLK
jgi:hypothetical protein